MMGTDDEKRSTATDGRELRVLMVEDSADDVLLVEHEIRRTGLKPVIAQVQSFDDMKAALERSRWDIILSDHNMPHFSSQDALALLQHMGQDIPFILVSGSIGEDQAVQAMKAGAHDYVMKDKLNRLVPAILRELREASSRTARRKAEEALRLSEQRFRELVEQIPAVTYIAGLDEDRTAFYISPQISAMLGVSQDDHRHLWRRFLHPDDRERVALELAHTREHLKPFSCSYRMVSPDGRTVWFQDDAAVVRDDSGRPAYLRGFMQDITARRRTEEALSERDEQLRKVQKLEAIGRLAGGVAHDFNNLLTPILGYAKLLQENAVGGGEDQGACVDEIVRAAERAANLTRQLLAFSRKQIPQLRPVQINHVVADMERFLRRTIGEDIELVTKLLPELGWVRADPTHVEQVIMNLGLNARDAMSGGGRLEICTENVELTDADSIARADLPAGAYVLLRVSDTGDGMSNEVREHVFEPFFTTKSEGKGTGLGLSIVYGIVQQCHGSIRLDSEPGRGTTFDIYFPRVEAPSERLPSTPPNEVPRGQEEVLVVEDEGMVRRLTVRILSSLGYQVTEASSGTEALAARRHRNRAFDLVLTDVVMPQMGGRELADELARFGDTSRVIYMSGFTQDELVLRGLERNPDRPLLMKPFTREVLARAVRDALGARGTEAVR